MIYVLLAYYFLLAADETEDARSSTRTMLANFRFHRPPAGLGAFYRVLVRSLLPLLLREWELAGALRERPASSSRCDERNVKKRKRYGRTEKKERKVETERERNEDRETEIESEIEKESLVRKHAEVNKGCLPTSPKKSQRKGRWRLVVSVVARARTWVIKILRYILFEYNSINTQTHTEKYIYIFTRKMCRQWSTTT